MRSSSLNWPSRSSGSSHLNAASLICAALTLRFSVFSATCDIGGLLPYSVTLRRERSEPRRVEARRAQPHPSRAAARPPQDDGMFPGKLRSLRSVRQGWPRCRSRSVSIFRGQAPVAQLDRALPSEGRGQGFESLRARQQSQDLTHLCLDAVRPPSALCPCNLFGARSLMLSSTALTQIRTAKLETRHLFLVPSKTGAASRSEPIKQAFRPTKPAYLLL